MKYDRLYNFISPLTGKLPIDKGYILLGDKDGRSYASPVLIDIRQDIIDLRRAVGGIDELKKLGHNKIWIGDYTNEPVPQLHIGVLNLPVLGAATFPYPSITPLPPVPIPNPTFNPLSGFDWLMSGPWLPQIFAGSTNTLNTSSETVISSSLAMTQVKVAQAIKRLDVTGFIVKNKNISFTWENPAMAAIPSAIKSLYGLNEAYTFTNAQALDEIGEGLLHNDSFGNLSTATLAPYACWVGDTSSKPTESFSYVRGPSIPLSGGLPSPTVPGNLVIWSEGVPFLTGGRDIADSEFNISQLVELEGQVEIIQGQIETIQGQVSALEADVAALDADVAGIDLSIAGIELELLGISGSIATIEGEIAALQGQVTTLEGSVATIQGQITTIFGDITILQTSVAANVLAIGACNLRIDNLRLNTISATADVSLHNYKIINLADGVASTDAINKGQLDARISYPGDTNKFLRADGTWTTTLSNSTSSGIKFVLNASNPTAFNGINFDEGTAVNFQIGYNNDLNIASILSSTQINFYTGGSSIPKLILDNSGNITTGVWNASIVGLAYGGTNANLTASNGGIVYSTASAMAVLSGVATANKILLSGPNSAPSWSSCTLIDTYSTLRNLFLGTNAGNSTLSGQDNTIFGELAGSTLTSGSFNALFANGAGYVLTTGSYNSVFGMNSFASATSASNNSFFGQEAGRDGTTGNNNTGCGQGALSKNITGSGNSALGRFAGQSQVSYTNCSFFGNGADASINGLSNAAAIGYNASVSVSNAMVLGNAAYIGIGNSSPAYTLDLGNIANQCGIKFSVSTSTPTTPSGTNSIVLFNNAGVPSYVNTLGNIVPLSTSGVAPAPSTSKYIIQTADAALPNAQSLGSLSNGIIKNTTSTGILSIAVAGTDYYAPGFPTYLRESYGASNNLYVGTGSGTNPIGSQNTCLGIESQTAFLSSGNNNTSVGFQTLRTVTFASFCTAVGTQSGLNNVTDSFTAFGSSAGRANTFGADICVGGRRSLFSSASNSRITAWGNFTFENLTDTPSIGANDNTAMGHAAGRTYASYTQCSFFGSGADASANNLTNAAAFGYNAKVSASNALILGGTGSSKVFVGIGNTAPYTHLHLSDTITSGSGGTTLFLENKAGGAAESRIDSVNYNAGNNPSVRIRFQDDNSFSSHIDFMTKTPGSGSNPLVSRLYISSSGNIGINNTTPNAPLQFASTEANRKIVLWDVSNNNHQFFGFGINAGILRHQVNGTGSSYVWYAATSTTTSNELMRLTGNGYLNLGTTSSVAGLVVASFVQNVAGEASCIRATSAQSFTKIEIDNTSASGHLWELRSSNNGDFDITDRTGLVTPFYIKTNTGRVGIGTNSPDQLLTVNSSNASKVGGGTWSAFSDARIKDITGNYEHGLAEILQVNVKTFKYNEKSGYLPEELTKERIGVIAQEIEPVFPECIVEKQQRGDIPDMRVYDSSALTYALINAVKELNSKITNLEQQLTR